MCSFKVNIKKGKVKVKEKTSSPIVLFFFIKKRTIGEEQQQKQKKMMVMMVTTTVQSFFAFPLFSCTFVAFKPTSYELWGKQ